MDTPETSNQIVENLGAMAVLGGALLLGVRWILSHVTKLSDQNFKILTGLLEKNTTTMGEVSEVVRQNTALLSEVGAKISNCALATQIIARTEPLNPSPTGVKDP